MRLLEIFTSEGLLKEEQTLTSSNISIFRALVIGKIAKLSGIEINLTIVIEVRLDDWTFYHASLPGSTSENQCWLGRKARVVLLKHYTTLYEQISRKERGIAWHKEYNLFDETHAIHGGGLPLMIKSEGIIGVLLVSGLPYIEDHLLGVEVLTEFLARTGKLL